MLDSSASGDKDMFKIEEPRPYKRPTALSDQLCSSKPYFPATPEIHRILCSRPLFSTSSRPSRPSPTMASRPTVNVHSTAGGAYSSVLRKQEVEPGNLVYRRGLHLTPPPRGPHRAHQARCCPAGTQCVAIRQYLWNFGLTALQRASPRTRGRRTP